MQRVVQIQLGSSSSTSSSSGLQNAEAYVKCLVTSKRFTDLDRKQLEEFSKQPGVQEELNHVMQQAGVSADIAVQALYLHRTSSTRIVDAILELTP